MENNGVIEGNIKLLWIRFFILFVEITIVTKMQKLGIVRKFVVPAYVYYAVPLMFLVDLNFEEKNSISP